MPAAERGCEVCHREHQGRRFSLIAWVPSKEGFPHEKTGWPLEGRHRRVSCEACHEKRLVSDPRVRALIAQYPRAQTYLGLPTACSACHFDEHRGQLDGGCDSCHTAQNWKPAPGFDHSNTNYPLTGRHLEVACIKCHPDVKDERTPPDAFPAPKSRTFQKLASIAHAACTDCHADPHRGQLGPACESCHSTSGWTEVKAPTGGRDFHDNTRFPLRGLHAEVECRACHGPFPGVEAKYRGLAFARCADCHPDAHLGQLEAARSACDACHSVAGFFPPRFELADHQKTRFALLGAHQSVACSRCHAPEAALKAKIPAAVKRELARRQRPELFSLARFDVSGDLQSCETCHADPHAGQFEHRPGCAACHTVDTFHGAVAFDHSRDSRFALDGKHAKTPCEGCHRPEQMRGASVVRYRPLETLCDGCHADPHAGQFARGEGRTACDTCHRTSSFADQLFAHRPPFTDFLLDGQHAELECGACHPEVDLGEGRKARRYVALARECAGCHEDQHQGAFRGFTP
jgi:hypothetical protein